MTTTDTTTDTTTEVVEQPTAYEVWYERLDDLQRYDHDTDYADTDAE